MDYYDNYPFKNKYTVDVFQIKLSNYRVDYDGINGVIMIITNEFIILLDDLIYEINLIFDFEVNFSNFILVNIMILYP
jgi:hypothetical protein